MCMCMPLHIIFKTRYLLVSSFGSSSLLFVGAQMGILALDRQLRHPFRTRLVKIHTNILRAHLLAVLGVGSRGSKAASTCHCSSGHLCRRQTDAYRGTLLTQTMWARADRRWGQNAWQCRGVGRSAFFKFKGNDVSHRMTFTNTHLCTAQNILPMLVR